MYKRSVDGDNGFIVSHTTHAATPITCIYIRIRPVHASGNSFGAENSERSCGTLAPARRRRSPTPPTARGKPHPFLAQPRSDSGIGKSGYSQSRGVPGSDSLRALGTERPRLLAVRRLNSRTWIYNRIWRTGAARASSAPESAAARRRRRPQDIRTRRATSSGRRRRSTPSPPSCCRASSRAAARPGHGPTTKHRAIECPLVVRRHVLNRSHDRIYLRARADCRGRCRALSDRHRPRLGSLGCRELGGLSRGPC